NLDVVLSVYNPNRFRLDATQLTYVVSMAGDSVKIADGALDSRFTVQDRDSTIVTIPVSFTYAGLGAAGRSLMNTGAVNYRVSGDVTVGTPIGNFTRGYSSTGRFTTTGAAKSERLRAFPQSRSPHGRRTAARARAPRGRPAQAPWRPPRHRRPPARAR